MLTKEPIALVSIGINFGFLGFLVEMRVVCTKREVTCVTSWTRRENDDPRLGVCIGCKDYSTNGACSSSAGGENEFDAAKTPSAVSSRVRHGKWKFYAVRRGRRVGIFGN